ncbi:hypothetical protein [Plantactinospora sp. ZYX-F-223]|uniref:hypothetical protein n=1 Tax=Plantactinospora sp. ZYX-F-223 TaxID=3144103 RepID=UPI0031FC1227
MKYLLVIGAIVAVAIGAAGIVYGGYDDSPGLQLLSALLIIGTLAYGVRVVRRSR